jgi:nucleotide-binding universal stress UspA family protein
MCVSVVAAPALTEGSALADTSSGRHLEHLARLRQWVSPLGLPSQRLSLHVLEAADPATTLLALARQNHVDLIVLGAPGPGQMKLAWWRSVASGVTANAHCSVHVVRVPERRLDASAESDAPTLKDSA